MSQKSTKSGAKANAAPKGSTKQTSTNTNSNKHVTKISAKPSGKSSTKLNTKDTKDTKVNTDSAKLSKTDKNQAKIAKAAAKANGRPIKNSAKRFEKPLKKVFILARPFVAFGRYLRDSWQELRQVRWPSRKATWKMTLAVLCYCAIFIVFIIILDSFFTFIFNLLLGRN